MKAALAATALAAAALAGCDAAPPPRADPRGQQLRSELDRMTSDFSACVDKAVAAALADAGTASDPAGSIAIAAVKSCRPIRSALVLKVASFDRFGHPSRTAAQAEVVAEASVNVIEKELREAAVITIIKHQNNSR